MIEIKYTPGEISDKSTINELNPELKLDLETISLTSTPEILTNDILPSIDSSNEKSIVNT